MANNWENRDERARIAREHTQFMAQYVPADIQYSIDNTVLYTAEDVNGKGYIRKDAGKRPATKLLATDTVSAVMFAAGKYGKTAVLNFASFKSPGGMFINGSRAQEESMCHESCLYNVLDTKRDVFYDPNSRMLNKSLYMDRALYSPDIVFMRGNDIKKCDVITCAAPNATSVRKYYSKDVSEEQIKKVMRRRVFFVCAIAEAEKVRTLILGAFGCGVFGNSAKDVAEYFEEALPHTSIQNVLYAIPAAFDPHNYEAFKKVLESKRS